MDEGAHWPPSAEAGIAAEVSRRVSSILDAVQREADRLREEAREEASNYLAHSRHRADSLVAERQRRIAELSDEIVRGAEAVAGRLHDADPVRAGFDNLLRGLADAAERLSTEAQEGRWDFQPTPFHYAERPAPPPLGTTVAPPPAPTRYQPPSPPPAPPTRYEPPSAGWPEPATPPTQAYAGDPEAAARGAPRPQAPGDPRLVAIQMAAAGGTRRQIDAHLRDAMGIAETEPVLDELFGGGSPADARVPWADPG